MSDIERDERGRIVIKSLSSEKAREMARKRWEQPSQVELTDWLQPADLLDHTKLDKELREL